MAGIPRSDTRIINTPIFYKKKIIVWVEGGEDITFWQIFFPEKFKERTIHFKPAGGKNELKKIARTIAGKAIESLVALDKDYDDLLGKLIKDNRVVYTEGYSIENHLYNESVIDNLIAKYCRESSRCNGIGNRWKRDIEGAFKELMVYDFTSERLAIGITVMGDNCCRFLKTNSHKPDLSKVKEFIGGLSFRPEDVEESRKMLDKKSVFLNIKGPFLTQSLIRFLKNEINRRRGKSHSINREELFTGCILACELLMDSQQGLKKLKKKVRRALSACL